MMDGMKYSGPFLLAKCHFDCNSAIVIFKFLQEVSICFKRQTNKTLQAGIDPQLVLQPQLFFQHLLLILHPTVFLLIIKSCPYILSCSSSNLTTPLLVILSSLSLFCPYKSPILLILYQQSLLIKLKTLLLVLQTVLLIVTSCNLFFSSCRLSACPYPPLSFFSLISLLHILFCLLL